MFSKYKYVEGLIPLIDSDNKYFINYLGQVKDTFGNDLETSLDSDGYITVNVKSWDGKRDYRVCDLIVIHFKHMSVSKNDFNKIVGFHIDSCLANVMAKNIGYRFIGGALESNEYPGFYHIPSFARVLINKDGSIISCTSGKKLSWCITSSGAKNSIGGYRYVAARANNGKHTTMLRHRALVLAFLDYPNNFDYLVVNHKNGIPGDDFFDNLEIVERKDNNIHAFENNLRSQNKPVLVRNVLTNEITEYYSISECARKLGYPTDETIRQRLLNHGPEKTHQDGYQIKFKSDKRDWYISKNPQKDIEDSTQAIMVKVRDCKNNNVSFFNSAAEASKKTNVSISSIIYRLNKKDASPLRGFQFMNLYNNGPFPDFTENEYLDTLHNSSISVDCKNHLTGETISFDSVNKAVSYINRNISSILRKRKQLLIDTGWQVKYSDQDWIVYDDIEKELYIRTPTILAKREKDGCVLIAKNSNEMGNELRLDPKAIRKAALSRGYVLYHGYRFRLGLSNEPWPTNL